MVWPLGILKPDFLCQVFRWHPKIGPFGNWTKNDHSKTGFVRILNGYSIPMAFRWSIVDQLVCWMGCPKIRVKLSRNWIFQSCFRYFLVYFFLAWNLKLCWMSEDNWWCIFLTANLCCSACLGVHICIFTGFPPFLASFWKEKREKMLQKCLKKG